jgi:hypothetical protein
MITLMAMLALIGLLAGWGLALSWYSTIDEEWDE